MEKGQRNVKKGKIFENLGKNLQNLIIFWKRADDCMQWLHLINPGISPISEPWELKVTDTKSSDKRTEGQAIIHDDYSENYRRKQQIVVKCAYYGQGQFSFFTYCLHLYEKENNIICRSYILVTLENFHDCIVMLALL